MQPSKQHPDREPTPKEVISAALRPQPKSQAVTRTSPANGSAKSRRGAGKPLPASMPPLAPPLPDVQDDGPIVLRPDGYYWRGSESRQEFGPFETYEEAQAERDAFDEEAIAPKETMHEVEESIGLADWLDPETGEPAEGLTTPHLPPD